MTTFQELGINPKLIEATSALGFVTPTLIQEKSIPVLLSGTKDFIGLAQTGTGKTAAYGLPLLQLIDVEKRFPQALIVCPTRELCMQIVNEMVQFKKFTHGVSVVAVYGGASIGKQIKDLQHGTQIVVATPGRLIDLIERKAIQLDMIKYVVLDEADEMLNMGFQEDIEFILKRTPKRDSTWLFSATMPPEIRKVSKRYMHEPAEVTIGKINIANQNIDHQYYISAGPHRYETLKRIIDFHPGIRALIFARTKSDTQHIADRLTREGYDIDALHGDLSQPQRDKVMKAFRDGRLQLLIATDVAARGIDVQAITHVINYELPEDAEVYTHRSGRTARAGASGICMSIVNNKEVSKLRQFEKRVQATFHRNDIPTGKDVCRKQFLHFMDKLLQVDVSHDEYETYLPLLEEKFRDMSKEEVLKRVAAQEFDRFLTYYQNAEDLNAYEDSASKNQSFSGKKHSGKKESSQREFSDGEHYSTLFVNVGTKDGFYKASFLQFILDLSDLNKEVLGKIDMREMNSWVEVRKSSAQKMMKAIDGQTYRGRKVRMNESNRK